jgi:uncharacterized protein (DUF58 family)
VIDLAKPVARAREVGTVRRLSGLIRERLSPRGRAYLWVVFGLGFLGLDTRKNQTFILFAIAASVLVVAMIAGRFARARARLELHIPPRATAGRPLTLRGRVLPTEGVGEGVVSFPRTTRGISIEPRQRVVALEGDASEITFTLTAPRRGRYEIVAPTLRALDPFGLVAGRAPRSREQAVLVYPRFYTMERFELSHGRRHQPGGIPLTSSTGDAVEFIGTRDFRAGDPVRNIHFRSWARRGAPVVKEFQEEWFCRMALVLDTFGQNGETFEAAISVVASITDWLARSEYVVDVLAAGPDLYRVSVGRSLAYLENVLDVLACLEPSKAPPFETIGPSIFEELAQLTTVVAVLLDWDPRRAAFLQKIRALGTEVRAIVVRAGPTSTPIDDPSVEVMTPTEVERALA